MPHSALDPPPRPPKGPTPFGLLMIALSLLLAIGLSLLALGLLFGAAPKPYEPFELYRAQPPVPLHQPLPLHSM